MCVGMYVTVHENMFVNVCMCAHARFLLVCVCERVCLLVDVGVSAVEFVLASVRMSVVCDHLCVHTGK